MMRLSWLVPGDRGGGVIWVADACCRQAVAAGYEATLLTMEPLSQATAQGMSYSVTSMDVTPPYADTPARFVRWVHETDPNAVFLNNCDTMDQCIPHLPPEVRCVYVVHDTMSFYWKAAVEHEASLDAIVAVSGEVARRFRHQLKDPGKLHVIQNGTVFPEVAVKPDRRDKNALVFLGGGDPRKGAYDLLKLWTKLEQRGFSGTLHWYGRVSDSLKHDIEALPAADRITLYGHVPRTQVFDRLNRSAVLLMLSRAEACSISVLEGMSMGCVPVAWDIEGTGTKEIISEDLRFLAPLADYSCMANQVVQAIAQRDNAGPALADLARTRFTETRMWHDYNCLIRWIKVQPLAKRPRSDDMPEAYTPPLRASHLVPRSIWKKLRVAIARSPAAYYFLRNRL
jgi:glycosyltransferase involved in cell wall biosynthesis